MKKYRVHVSIIMLCVAFVVGVIAPLQCVYKANASSDIEQTQPEYWKNGPAPSSTLYVEDYWASGMKYKVYHSSRAALFVINVTKDSLEVQELIRNANAYESMLRTEVGVTKNK